MFVYSQTMQVQDHFTTTETFVVNYKKISTQGPSHNIGWDLVTYV